MSAPSVPRIVPRPTSRNGLLRFYWSPPLSDGDGSGISSYTLVCSTPSVTQSFGLGRNREDIIGLSNGVPYTFEIYATNSNGISSASATFLTRVPCDVPDNPENVNFLLDRSTNSVLVQWSTPTNKGGGDTILNHNAIYLYPVDLNSNILSNFSTGLNQRVYAYGSSNTRLIYYPSSNYNYKFIVRSINDAGWSFDDINKYVFLNIKGDFLPTDLNGLYVWLDSSSSSTIQLSPGITVSTLSSRVGNLIFNQAPTNYTLPSLSSFSTTNINNLQSITFNGNAISQVSTLSSIRHFFWVGRQGTYLTENTLLGHNSLNDWRGSNNNYTGQLGVSSILFAPTVLYVNGTAPRTANSSSNLPLAPLNRPFLLNINPLSEPTRFQGLGFFSNSGSSRGWNGNFGEMLVYSNSLTTREINAINNYLIRKWFPSPSNFSPSSIGSCLFWLDMSQPGAFTMSGSNVSTIRDFSSNVNNLRQVPSVYANPVLGSSINTLSTIRVGSGRALTQPSTLNGVRHLFWVGRQLSNAGLGFLFGHDDSANASIYDWHPANGNVNFIGTQFGSPSLTSATATIYNKNTDFRYQATFNGMSNPTSNSVFLLNVNPVSPFTTRFQGITFDRNSLGRGWTGDLAEVICYNSTLTIQQQEQIEAYLKQKWAIFPEAISTPTQLSSLQLWLDATDPLGNGTIPAQSTLITNWVDKSGLGRNAVANTSSNFYINSAISGKPSISIFPDAYLSGAISPNYTGKPWYVFIVFSGNTNTWDFGRLISFGDASKRDFDNTSNFAIFRNNGDNIGITRNSISLTTSYSYRNLTSIPNGALVTTIFDGTSNAQVRLNGLTVATGNSSTYFENLNLSLYRLGKITSLESLNTWSGFISEVLVYSNLTIDQVESVEAYLKQKWIV